MLQITDLVKKFGKFTAVNGLNLEIPDKSIFGFVGPNGAGKTTTMKIIAGLLRQTSGRVVINGMDVSHNPRGLREKIGYMPDFFGVYDNLKVSEYMDFYCGMYGIPYKNRKEIVGDLLELVELAGMTDSYVDTLSRGMKQRLCLARSMVHDPEVLVLDEPASGLDPRARVEMKEILKQLSKLGKTIIISSHILPELAEICTMIGILNKGEVIASGSVGDIMQSMTRSRRIYAKALSGIEELLVCLRENPDVGAITEKVNDIEFGFTGDDAALAKLLREIIAKDIPIVSFVEKEGNLEEIFMILTEGGSVVV